MAQETIRYGHAIEAGARYSCLALVVGPEGKVPLVREFRRAHPLWKLAGGRNQPNEEPIDTIIREISEELGLTAERSNVQVLDTIDRGDHYQHVFLVAVDTFDGLHEFGQENGSADLEVRLFQQGALMREGLLPPHRALLEEQRPALRKLGVVI